MKKRKKYKICSLCFLIVSISFYIYSIIGFITKSGNNTILNISLGSTFLCLASILMNKDKK